MLKFYAEYWEEGEYIILGPKGPVGGTLSKADAYAVANWLGARGGAAELLRQLGGTPTGTPPAGQNELTSTRP